MPNHDGALHSFPNCGPAVPSASSAQVAQSLSTFGILQAPDAWLTAAWGKGNARGPSSPNWLGQQPVFSHAKPTFRLTIHGSL